MSRQKKFEPFPSWRWHPEFPEGQVFHKEEDVPEGAVDHPSKLKPTAKQIADRLPARKLKP